MNGLRLRELTLYSILGGMLFAAKMAMAFLPNIEPVSLLVMLLAVCFGWKGLFAVYIYVFLEIALWGIGIWSAAYLYVWPVLFALARLLRPMDSALGWALLSGGFGLLFGALCAPLCFFTGGWAAALTWWIAGIPMDLAHGAGNFCLALVLFRPLRRCLDTLIRHWNIRPDPR